METQPCLMSIKFGPDVEVYLADVFLEVLYLSPVLLQQGSIIHHLVHSRLIHYVLRS